MRVHVGLGCNLGDCIGHISSALEAVDALPETRVAAVSHAYETECWPSPEDPAFVNAVAVIETGLAPNVLLEEFKRIEVEVGRDLGAPFNSPRPIDLDILLAEDEEWRGKELVIPHPRMAERDFVITPLLEVDPDAKWPSGRPVTRCAVLVGRVIGDLGEIAGFEGAEPRPVSRDEEWVSVLEFGSDPSLFGEVGPAPLGGLSGQVGMEGQIDGSFAELVLKQAGIATAWDPFAPGESNDPYGFGRRFRLRVPASRAEEARTLLAAAKSAPIDWEEAE